MTPKAGDVTALEDALPALAKRNRPMVWKALYIAAALALILYRKGRNTVWGTATLGLIAGVCLAAYRAATGHPVTWELPVNAIAIGVLAGLAIDLLSRAYTKT